MHKAPRTTWPSTRRRLDGRTILLGLALLIIGYLTIPPILTVFIASFQTSFLSADSEWTIANYVRSVTEPAYLGLIANSLLFGFGTTLLATSFGTILAWLFMRTDASFKPFILLTATLPFFIPGLLNTFAHIFLLSPQIGLLNYATEATLGVRPFAVYSLPGMIYVQAIHVTPIAFAMLIGIFRSMDVTLEESARASGANDYNVLRHITLKLATPGIFSAALLIFVETISSFEVPALIGVPGGIYVFVSEIYETLTGYPQDLGSAATLSMLVLIISLAGISFSYRLIAGGRSFATVTGKGYRPQPMKLGRWSTPAFAFVAAYFIAAVVLPVLVLVWVSLLPGYEQPTAEAFSRLSFDNYLSVMGLPRIGHALANSFQATLVAACFVMVLTAVAAYVTTKTRLRGRSLVDALIFIPIAIPGTVLGVSILYWYLMAPLPVSLYGTLTLIIIGFVTLYLPYGMRFMAPAMLQINTEMEEAARVSGAPFLSAAHRIYLPLIRAPMLAGFLLVFILAFREVSASIFLFAQDTELFSLALFDLWGEGLFGFVSALGIMMMVGFTLVVAAAQKVFGLKILGGTA